MPLHVQCEIFAFHLHLQVPMDILATSYSLHFQSPSQTRSDHQSSSLPALVKMALTIRTLVLALLLLILTSITTASPLLPSQSSVAANLTACALSPLLIEQFSAFSGSASVKPHVTFFLTNPNGGAPGKMLCTATLGDGEGNFNGSKFYSCEQVGSGFSYQTAEEGDGEGRLSLFQYQICTVGLVKCVLPLHPSSPS